MTSSAETPDAPRNVALKSFLSGGCGGITMVGVSHPFDLTKVLMQTGDIHNKPTLQVMRSILAQNGMRGLYKGVWPVMGAAPPVLATCMWSYHVGQVLIRDAMGGPGRPLLQKPNADLIDTLTITQIGIAGAFSAVPTALILGPAEQVKIRLQVARARTTAVGELRQIWKEGGVRGVFRGTGLTLMRDVPGSFFYFATYETIKRALTEGIDAKLNPATVLLSGGMAGMVNWTVAIPIDTVKSRFQSSGASGSLGACFRQILAEGGIPALFRGLGPTLIRAFPASAAFFGGVEGSKVVLNKLL